MIINVTVNGVPFTVNIFVEGPQPPDLLVQPQTLTFGTAATPIQVGQSSSLPFTITNQGSNQVDNITLDLGQQTEFTVDQSSIAALGPGASATVTVTFSPAFDGESFGFIDIQVGTDFFPGVNLQGFGDFGPRIFDGLFLSDGTAGVTQVAVFGEDLPTDITTFTVGGNVITVTFAGFEDPLEPEDVTIKGTINLDISTFSAGNFAVTLGTLSFPQVLFEIFITGGAPQIIDGEFFSDGVAGVTQVEIIGADFPADVTGVTVTGPTLGTFTLSGLTVAPDPLFPEADVIKGTIPVDITTVIDSLIDVTLTSTSQGPISFPQVLFHVDRFDDGGGPGPGPVGFELHGGDFFDAGAGNITVKIFGSGFPADIVSSSITITGPGITADGAVVTGVSGPFPDPNDTSGNGQFIEGTIATVFASLVEGPYSVDIISGEGTFNFPDQFFFLGGPGGGTTEPTIFDGDIFGKIGQNVSIVEIFGANLPTTLSTITVGGHTVSVTRAGPDPDSGFSDDIEIIGTIAADISTFAGDTQILDVTIEGQTFTGIEFNIFKASDAPEVIAGDVGSAGANITKVEIFGANLPSATADYTSVTVNGNTVNGVVVTVDTEFEVAAGIVVIEIIGTISLDISAFATADQEEVSLDVTLEAAALPGGSLTETGIRFFVDQFDDGGGTPGGVFVSDLGIFPNPDGPPTTIFEVHGDGFTVGNVVSIEIFRDGVPEFGPFQVAQLSVDQFSIEYIHTSDISTLVSGNYSAIVATTEGTFETPSFFFEAVGGPGTGPIFGWILFTESANAGEVDVTIFGEGFEQLSTAFVVSFSTGSDLTGTVYTLFGHFVTPGDAINPGKIEGRIIANSADLNLDQYWVSLLDGVVSIEHFVPVDLGGGTPGESGIFEGSFGPSDDAASTFVELKGFGLPAVIDNVSITGTDGIKHTFVTLLVSDDPDFPENTVKVIYRSRSRMLSREYIPWRSVRRPALRFLTMSLLELVTVVVPVPEPVRSSSAGAYILPMITCKRKSS